MKRLLILTVVAILAAATTGCSGTPRWRCWRPVASVQPAIPCDDGHIVGSEVYNYPPAEELLPSPASE